MNIKLMIVGQYVKYVILVFVIKGDVYLRYRIRMHIVFDVVHEVHDFPH